MRHMLRLALPLFTLAGTAAPFAATALLASTPLVARADEPLPTDPALVTGEFANGVKYIIRKHANPPGRVAVWMHVGSGGLNEEAAELGVAHYLEHMAFNGSTNFPPGEVVKFFESLGLTFGQHQNAFTSIDQTTYQLALADQKPESLDKALLFFSDVAFRLTLDPTEIDQERQIILEEKRARLSPGQRVQDQVLKRIAPGSRFETHIPLVGTEQTIQSVQRPAFEQYWKTWYAPGNITLMIVGDMEPEQMRALAEKHFAGEPARPLTQTRDVGVKAQSKDAAIVVTDPEQQRAEVSFAKIAPPDAPSTTMEGLRDDLVEMLGTWVLNQRLAKKLEAGEVAFINADVGIQNVAKAIRWTSASVTAEPAKWGQAFKDLAIEVQRARLHGFTEDELALARATLIASGEQQAARDGTQPAQVLLRSYNQHISDGEPIMSGKQTLAALQKLLPTITAEEVSKRFTKEFDPSNLTFVAELPSSGDVPSEPELVAFGKAALAVTPAKEKAEARITSVLEKKPTPGKAMGVDRHAASEVTNAWLPSGALVHHRFVDIEKGKAAIVITFAGGEIEETADNRGVTGASTLAFNRAATSNLRSTQIREFMSDKKVEVSASKNEDSVTVTISGDPEDLETGLQLFYAVATDPVVENAAFEQWRTSMLQAIAQRKQIPQGVFQEMLADTIFPTGEVRTRPETAEQVQALTAKQAQAWIQRLVNSAPMEVAVVGDIKAEDAMPLVETYIGSLPARPRIAASTFASLRELSRTPGPKVAERSVKTETQQSIVLAGFFGADANKLEDVRLLNLASRVLSVRMNKVIREQKQLVYGIGSSSRPAMVWPGFGMFIANAPTDAAKVPVLIKELFGIYDAFAADGPTDEEIRIAQGQIFNTLDEQMKSPGYWTAQLRELEYRDRKLDDIMKAKEAYAKYTAKDVHNAFKKFYTPESRMTFTVTPESKE